MLYKITALIACNYALTEGVQIETTRYNDNKADWDHWDNLESQRPLPTITHRAKQALEDIKAGNDTWATFKLIDSHIWGSEAKIELESWSWGPDTDKNYK